MKKTPSLLAVLVIASAAWCPAADARAPAPLDERKPLLPEAKIDPPVPAWADFVGGFDAIVERFIPEEVRARQSDPLKFLAGDMGVIVGDLTRYQTDEPVQARQRKVLASLDELIRKLEKSCNKSGSGSGANPSKPMQDSRLVGGPGGIKELLDPRKGEKKWADLPPKQREQILQSRTEGFPAGYEAVLEKYYNRLSQEKVVDESDAPAGGK